MVRAGADQFQHSDFSNLAQRSCVDDKGDNCGTDNPENDQEHPYLLADCGYQFATRIYFHLVTGVGLQMLPAFDFFGDICRQKYQASRNQNSIDVPVCWFGEAWMASSKPEHRAD